MPIFPNNCQFGSKFWIRPDKADAFLLKCIPNAAQGREWNPGPLAQTDHRALYMRKVQSKPTSIGLESCQESHSPRRRLRAGGQGGL
jgi:hypothetical protein